MARHLGSAMYSYNPDSKRGMGKLLVTKRVMASWDIRCMTQLLLIRAQVWLGKLMKESSKSLGGMVPIPKVYQIGELPPELKSVEAWSAFRACLVLPWDPSGLNTYDVYALGLPMFIPDPLRFLPSFVYRSQAGSALMNKPGPPPKPGEVFWPGFWRRLPNGFDQSQPNFGKMETGGGWDSFRIWTMLTEFGQLPHVRHISALSDLIFQLLDIEGLKATSQSMITHHRELHA
eukprot:CAMPEP_0177452000 /NCGR_PEP_ID=MMETSP0369-20130122/10078_1 /TAXON_ID=447022 ORGANISM="Scrippsiella hangoei-like, Strain SHHI-4" /NCGR_SAMPLE_ID=MMETSP0369 /ASSEMBLY_ACC=CAM_ASM_000364 /LENGTH=231 /DNA_ID=CAMNT_0018924651 /DNA_START=33 /DNA_END=725 /DNA_ORIENTATION=-